MIDGLINISSKYLVKQREAAKATEHFFLLEFWLLLPFLSFSIVAKTCVPIPFPIPLMSPPSQKSHTTRRPAFYHVVNQKSPHSTHTHPSLCRCFFGVWSGLLLLSTLAANACVLFHSHVPLCQRFAIRRGQLVALHSAVYVCIHVWWFVRVCG